MRLLPFERLTLRTGSPPEVVQAKLANLIAIGRHSLTPAPKSLRGSVKGGHFKVVPVLGTFFGVPTQNAWQPLILGDIVPVGSGTEVRIRMRLRALVGVFTALWFGSLLWVAGRLLRAGSLEGFGPSGGATGPGVDLVAIAAMMLAGYTVVSVSFWTDVRKARRALSEGLGCREVETGNRLVRR